MILVTVIAIVCMMAVFSSFYNKYYYKVQSTNINRRVVRSRSIPPPGKGLIDYLFSGVVYVINILTNHGIQCKFYISNKNVAIFSCHLVAHIFKKH